MQARQTQAAPDHARLPAHRPGEGPEPGEGGYPQAAAATASVAVEQPRPNTAAGPAAASVSSGAPGRAAAGRTSSPGAADPTPRAAAARRLLLNLDVIVLVPAVLLALALGAPAFGVLVGAGAWLVQRLVAMADGRMIARAAEPGSRLGLNFIDAFARIWLLAGAIILAGAAGSHQDGLAAALVILGAYSIAFAVRIARGREAGPS